MSPEILELLAKTPNAATVFFICYYAYRVIRDIRPELLVTVFALMGSKERRKEARELLAQMQQAKNPPPDEVGRVP